MSARHPLFWRCRFVWTLGLVALLSFASAQRPPTYLLVTTPEIASEQPYSGELTRDDGQNFKDGSFVEVVKFRARAEDVVDLRARSAFPTVLSLYGPDGQLVGASDRRDETTTILALELPQTGRYIVAVSGRTPNDLGPFTLSARWLDTVDNALLQITDGEATFTGVLSERDEQRQERYLDTFGLQIDTTGRYRLGIDSPVFDGALRLLQGETVITAGDAVLERRLAAGDYRLVATTTAADTLGIYTLTLTSLGNPESTLLSLPDDVSGTLDGSDPQRDGRFADAYAFVVRPARDTETDAEPTEVTIVLSASAFDPYLLLYREQDDGGEVLVAENDDGPDGPDALISEGLEPGRYRLVATSFAPGRQGDYRLSLRTTEAERATIGLPDEVSAALSTDDAQQEGRYRDRYLLIIDTTTELGIDLTSEVFDARLELRTESGDLIAEDDDGGDGTNARLQRTLTPARYYLVATSTFGAVTGPYTLSVVPTSPP